MELSEALAIVKQGFPESGCYTATEYFERKEEYNLAVDTVINAVEGLTKKPKAREEDIKQLEDTTKLITKLWVREHLNHDTVFEDCLSLGQAGLSFILANNYTGEFMEFLDNIKSVWANAFSFSDDE